MIPVDEIQKWKVEAQEGPTKVVWDDIGDDYKQRAVVMTFHYDRYMRLLDEVVRLQNLNASLATESDELRQSTQDAAALFRRYPGCGNPLQHEQWLEDVAILLG
jgi:hypothetical protein